ncbi:hypothetical protein EK21DRAFT_117641 [Setomelanomma holmii]|uniref:Uncharacterized protein n=1 Tax=Setomelanomma holmii TaxID=210430 RepID=A0A9P4LGV3_9PLEO|nr:hypothetical protein EK21DRAFT_117641 [Setomelanomma holmii]
MSRMTPKSASSSLYSDDEAILTPSSTDIRDHDQSQAGRNMASLSCEYDQFFERSASNVLGSSTENQDSAVDPALHTTYRYETAAEAEERRRRSAAIARAEARLMAWVESYLPTVNGRILPVNVDGTLDYLSQASSDFTSSPQSSRSPEVVVADVGTRPPTPPRRRPRLSTEELQSLGSRCNTVVSSLQSLAESSETEALGLAVSNGVAESETVEQAGPTSRAQQILDNAGSSALSVPAAPASLFNSTLAIDGVDHVTAEQQQANREHALQALVANSADVDAEVAAGRTHHEIATVTSKASGTKRRQGKSDWSNNITTGNSDRSQPTLVSSTVKVYGLGNHSLGYSSGTYVTDLQRTQAAGKQGKKSRSLRLFCM